MAHFPKIQHRFLSRVEPGETSYNGTRCLEWTGMRNKDGYGRFYLHPREIGGERYVAVYAHRWAYEHWKGPIPEGLVIDHLCNNPPCVNVNHMEPVTQSENARRVPTRRTHCKWGHEFTPENTALTGRGWRVCLTCRNGRNRGRPRKPRTLKLSANDIHAIRRACAAGERQIDIAIRYSVSKAMISHIVTKRTWAHVSDS